MLSAVTLHIIMPVLPINYLYINSSCKPTERYSRTDCCRLALKPCIHFAMTTCDSSFRMTYENVWDFKPAHLSLFIVSIRSR